MTYLPPPKNAFDVEWATQNNRIIQQELGRLQPLQVRVADLESGKQPLDGDLTAIAALTGTGYIRRTADDTWAISATIPNTSVTGLGTMSTQDANAVDIDGGSIDGTAIGAATPSTGAFTTLSTTGAVSLATAGGNIGAGGTASANYKLEVLSPSGLGPNRAFKTGLGATVGQSGGGYDGYGYNVRFTTTTNSFQYNTTDTASFLQMASGGFQFFTAPSGTAGNTITFTERMRIDQSTGNVGLGTLSPSEKLSVAGNISATGTLSASNLAGTTYTPTLRSTVDVNIASSTFQSASYIRVGSAVMATIQLFITPSASGSVRFSISLPVASNFTTNYQLGGNCSARDTVPLTGMVIGSATNDNAVAEFVAATTNAHEVTVLIFYPIL